MVYMASQPSCKWPRHEHTSVLTSQAGRMDVVTIASFMHASWMHWVITLALQDSARYEGRISRKLSHSATGRHSHGASLGHSIPMQCDVCCKILPTGPKLLPGASFASQYVGKLKHILWRVWRGKAYGELSQGKALRNNMHDAWAQPLTSGC